MNTLECHIYRCAAKEEMYLYLHVDKKQEDLPEELTKLVKQLSHVMDLVLSPERKLARVDVNEVINSLKEKGYFLQMPPKGIYTKLHYGD
jgi:uncharacterized protein YcgL (UPF0745 family)